MHILVTGSSGFIGSNLVPFLMAKGYTVNCLVRYLEPMEKNQIYWDPKKKLINLQLTDKYEVILHLAGENIAKKRWSRRQKEKIYSSRIQGTHFLIQSLLNLKNRPKVFICASAVGYYGNCADEIVDEDHQRGRGFLADVCADWEQETKYLIEKKIRVINLRFGIILSTLSGALAKMLPFFKLGLGGKMGTGNQYISWISLEDCLRAIDFIIKSDFIHGAVNVVSPNAVTNEEFARTLGRVLKKPVFFMLPSPMLRVILGQMADELLLSSTRAIPKKLLANGFIFQHEKIKEVLSILVAK
jgi:uncharacterized protein (TIGR01777 family)